MNGVHVVGHERESSHLFKCIISIKEVLITLWCGGYVKCGIPWKDDGLRLNICECYSWEIGLNAAFHNARPKGLKDAEEVNSTKHLWQNLRLSIKFSKGVALVSVCASLQLALAVGIATGYGLEDGGFGVRVPVGSRIFSSQRHPDRFWGPSGVTVGYKGLFP
jgi:hypothetical protein